MAKRDIRMSDDEIARFLAAQSTATVIGSPPSGAPSAAVGRLEYDDGAVAFSVHDDDPVVALLADDDRTCCVVEQFPSYYEIAGVMLHGRARRRDAAAPGEATFDLAVEKVVSFDFAKLRDVS
ncbi:MAG TPA: hypothetical protein VFZ17_00435 [Acidimicrobiia bacterium]|nr:hypothetical protein [Acidimicrobiia bacterium]